VTAAIIGSPGKIVKLFLLAEKRNAFVDGLWQRNAARRFRWPGGDFVFWEPEGRFYSSKEINSDHWVSP